MFKINKISAFTGLTIRTLRYYDEIGLVSPMRDKNGHRHYSYADLIRLNEIKLLKEAGLSLSEIRKIAEGTGASTSKESFIRQKILLENKLKDIQKQITKLNELEISCNNANSIEDRIIEEILNHDNPLKTEINKIWSLKNQKETIAYYLKNFNKPLDFDAYYKVLSKLQNKPISCIEVQTEIEKYIVFLINYYNNTIDKNGLIIIANAYQKNDCAIQYLKIYGEDFPSFLCNAMINYLSQN